MALKIYSPDNSAADFSLAEEFLHDAQALRDKLLLGQLPTSADASLFKKIIRSDVEALGEACVRLQQEFREFMQIILRYSFEVLSGDVKPSPEDQVCMDATLALLKTGVAHSVEQIASA